ncbi:hypothetical protein H4J57_19315 [Colwellia sp. BRX8-7]|jgi:hypothetical protein|uniref:hypothetical protein n=1 Tax=Colwellia sp. BRX8-7 TaxID=2759833 RepID=UPI0015F6689A|nr:hypothetical protein [Colwellia sp. BRX8-7]MBA6339337.1 hypothetical protein [Colwellia sp. BRX8-7]
MTKSHVILIATALCLAYSTYHFYSLENKNSKIFEKQNLELTSTLKTLDNKLKAQVSALMKELKDNQAMIALLQKSNLKMKEKNIENLSEMAEESPSNIKEKQQESSYDLVEEKQKANKFFKSFGFDEKSLKNYKHGIDENFEEELVDYNWAPEYEQNIRALVNTDDTSSYDIQELTCKSTACEIKLAATQDEGLFIGRNFTQLLKKQKWFNKNGDITFYPIVADGTIRVRVVRSEL